MRNTKTVDCCDVCGVTPPDPDNNLWYWLDERQGKIRTTCAEHTPPDNPQR